MGAGLLYPKEDRFDVETISLDQSGPKLDLERMMFSAKRWLFDHLQLDGSYGKELTNLCAYYKSPLCFTLSDEKEAALKSLDYLRREYIQQDGTCLKGKGNDSDFHIDEYTLYPVGWTCLASYELGQKEIFEKQLSLLLSNLNHKDGGVKPNLHSPYYDMITSAHVGYFLLKYGDLELTSLVATFLEKLMLAQQIEDRKIYLRVDSKTLELAREYPEEKERFFAINLEKTNQDYFHLGYPIGFLCELSSITRNGKWISLAENYFELLMECNEDVCRYLISGKIGWSSAWLYKMTGKSIYKNTAARFLNFIQQQQTSLGYWSFKGDENHYSTFDITSELIIWLSRILSLKIL